MYTTIGIPLAYHGDDITTFVADRGADNLVHLHGTSEVWQALQVFGTPTHIMIAKDGTVELGIGSMGPDVLVGDWAIP